MGQHKKRRSIKQVLLKHPLSQVKSISEFYQKFADYSNDIAILPATHSSRGAAQLELDKSLSTLGRRPIRLVADERLHKLLLNTPFLRNTQRAEAGNTKSAKSLTGNNSRTSSKGKDTRSVHSLKPQERSRASSSTGYPSSWNLDITKAEPMLAKAVKSEDNSLAELINCNRLKNTTYDQKLNVPLRARFPKSVETSIQCSLPGTSVPKQSKRIANGVVHTQTKTKTKTKRNSSKTSKQKVPRFKPKRNRLPDPTGIIQMDRILGSLRMQRKMLIGQTSSEKRVQSGETQTSKTCLCESCKCEKLDINTSRSSTRSKNKHILGTCKCGKLTKCKLVRRRHIDGGYTPTDCQSDNESDESDDECDDEADGDDDCDCDEGDSEGSEEPVERYNKIEKISQPPRGSRCCECSDSDESDLDENGPRMKKHTGTNWKLQLANERELRNYQDFANIDPCCTVCQNTKRPRPKKARRRRSKANDDLKSQCKKNVDFVCRPGGINNNSEGKNSDCCCKCPGCSNVLTQTSCSDFAMGVGSNKSSAISLNRRRQAMKHRSPKLDNISACKCPACTRTKSMVEKSMNAIPCCRKPERENTSRNRPEVSAKPRPNGTNPRNAAYSRNLATGRDGTSPRNSVNDRDCPFYGTNPRSSAPDRDYSRDGSKPRTTAPGRDGTSPRNSANGRDISRDGTGPRNLANGRNGTVPKNAAIRRDCSFCATNSRSSAPDRDYSRDGSKSRNLATARDGTSPKNLANGRDGRDGSRDETNPKSSANGRNGTSPRNLANGKDCPRDETNPRGSATGKVGLSPRNSATGKVGTNSRSSPNGRDYSMDGTKARNLDRAAASPQTVCTCQCPACQQARSQFKQELNSSRRQSKDKPIALYPTSNHSIHEGRSSTHSSNGRGQETDRRNSYSGNDTAANLTGAKRGGRAEQLQSSAALCGKTACDMSCPPCATAQSTKEVQCCCECPNCGIMMNGFEQKDKQRARPHKQSAERLKKKHKMSPSTDMGEQNSKGGVQKTNSEIRTAVAAAAAAPATGAENEQPLNCMPCHNICGQCKIIPTKSKAGEAPINLVVADTCNVNQLIDILQETVCNLEQQKNMIERAASGATTSGYQAEYTCQIDNNSMGGYAAYGPSFGCANPWSCCHHTFRPYFMANPSHKTQRTGCQSNIPLNPYGSYKRQYNNFGNDSACPTRKNTKPMQAARPNCQKGGAETLGRNPFKFLDPSRNVGNRHCSGSSYPFSDKKSIPNLKRRDEAAAHQSDKATSSFIHIFDMAMAMRENQKKYSGNSKIPHPCDLDRDRQRDRDRRFDKKKAAYKQLTKTYEQLKRSTHKVKSKGVIQSRTILERKSQDRARKEIAYRSRRDQQQKRARTKPNALVLSRTHSRDTSDGELSFPKAQSSCICPKLSERIIPSDTESNYSSETFFGMQRVDRYDPSSKLSISHRLQSKCSLREKRRKRDRFFGIFSKCRKDKHLKLKHSIIAQLRPSGLSPLLRNPNTDFQFGKSKYSPNSRYSNKADGIPHKHQNSLHLYETPRVGTYRKQTEYRPKQSKLSVSKSRSILSSCKKKTKEDSHSGQSRHSKGVKSTKSENTLSFCKRSNGEDYKKGHINRDRNHSKISVHYRNRSKGESQKKKDLTSETSKLSFINEKSKDTSSRVLEFSKSKASKTGSILSFCRRSRPDEANKPIPSTLYASQSKRSSGHIEQINSTLNTNISKKSISINNLEIDTQAETTRKKSTGLFAMLSRVRREKSETKSSDTLESKHKSRFSGLFSRAKRNKKEDRKSNEKFKISESASLKRRKQLSGTLDDHGHEDDYDVKVLYDSSYKFAKRSKGGDITTDCDCSPETEHSNRGKPQNGQSQNNFFCMVTSEKRMETRSHRKSQ